MKQQHLMTHLRGGETRDVLTCFSLRRAFKLFPRPEETLAAFIICFKHLCATVFAFVNLPLYVHNNNIIEIVSQHYIMKKKNVVLAKKKKQIQNKTHKLLV